MKSVVLSFLIILQISPASAACISRSEAKDNYKGCVAYLDLSVRAQIRIADSVGATRREAVKACARVKRAGLKKILANIDRYFCGSTPQNDSSPGRDEPVCRMSGDCMGGYCSASGRCMDGGTDARCDSSSQCASGYCNLTGRCS